MFHKYKILFLYLYLYLFQQIKLFIAHCDLMD
jgi:hypothetical protein